MANPDPNHVKGSHPNQAAHAEKNIRYLVIPAGTITYASAKEAHQAAPNGGTLMKVQGDAPDTPDAA